MGKEDCIILDIDILKETSDKLRRPPAGDIHPCTDEDGYWAPEGIFLVQGLRDVSMTVKHIFLLPRCLPRQCTDVEC